MPQEKEIKILLNISLEEFLARVLHYGFVKSSIIEQEDIYFDTKDWGLYENSATLRTRKISGQEKSFTYKKAFYTPRKHDNWYIDEIETSFPLQDTDILEQIFNRLQIPYAHQVFSKNTDIEEFLSAQDFQSEQKMKKTRSLYKHKDNELVIDNVEKVGIVIELECKKEEPLELIEKFLKTNEWSRSHEGTSYKWLEKVKGLNSHISNLKRFKKEPDWNVLPHERKLYNRISTPNS
jgi:adenylate cyclase class IV